MLRGKVKEGNTKEQRSASQSPKDKKKIPCHFHFVKKSCKKGKDCEFSPNQKVFDNYKKDGKGKGKSKSPRRTPSNTPKKIDEPCWNWAKGRCINGDSCRRRHDPHLFNTAPHTSEPASPALVRDFDSDDDAVICYKAASTTASTERVRFDMKKIDQVQYEQCDFVQKVRLRSMREKISEIQTTQQDWQVLRRVKEGRAVGVYQSIGNCCSQSHGNHPEQCR